MPTTSTKSLIIKFFNVLIIDQSGAYAIEDAIEQLEKRDVKVFFVGMTPLIESALSRIGTIHKIKDGNCFDSFEGAVLEIESIQHKELSKQL